MDSPIRINTWLFHVVKAYGLYERSFNGANQKQFLLRKQQKRVNSSKYMRKRFKRLKAEMKDISKEQQSIKEGQRQVRAKLEAIKEERNQLQKETNQIIQQSANTQIRLGVMFNILKAREQGDFDKAAQLTRLLREIVAKDNCKNEACL